MKKDILSSIENIEIYPIISLLIFFLFFVGMFWWVIRVDKKYLDHMKVLPFNEKQEKENGHEND